MPTSWASVLLGVAIALALAGASVLAVAIIAGTAFVIEVALDAIAAPAHDER